VNIGTNRFLDSDHHGNGYTLRNNGEDYQKWRVKGLGKEIFVLVNIATGRVLGSHKAGKVNTLPENGGAFQKWVLFRH
jgi:hypothetical protein